MTAISGLAGRAIPSTTSTTPYPGDSDTFASFPNPDRPQLASLVGWNEGHTIALTPIRRTDSVLLYCILYGHQEAAIEVRQPSALWSGRIVHPLAAISGRLRQISVAASAP